MSKFDHIKLSRAFRPVALAALKGHADWAAYMRGRGLSQSSESMTKEQILSAFEDLGIDLQAIFAQWKRTDDGAATAETAETADENGAKMKVKEEEPACVETGYEGCDVDDVIAEALAPASVHMTPHLASIMPGLLRPLVEAAVRGPRVVREVERVLVDSDGVEVKPAYVAPTVKVKSRAPLWQAFGCRKSDAPKAYAWAWENIVASVCDCVDAPAIDVDYVWQPELLCDLAAQDASGLNAWVFGPAGVGKTAGVEQYAARLKRPFFRIAIERTTEPAELIGQEVPAKGGGMKWADGKLTRAFRVPHAVILLDEPTLLRSGTLAVLQTALDHRALFLSTGETVRAAEGVFIVAADNTAGCGDDSGRYIDTAPVNAAFLDRFALKTEVGFLTATEETSMLSHRTGIPLAAARIMVEYATTTRTKADSGNLTMGVTPRRLMAWGHTVKAGIPSAKAWNSVIVTGAAPEDRECLIMLEATDLRGRHATIDAIVRGFEPNPVETVRASSEAARLEFPNDGESVA